MDVGAKGELHYFHARVGAHGHAPLWYTDYLM
jgi:hypothetical protein